MRKVKSSSLQVESLDQRDLPSASPLPVLLVVADQQDFYYREYAETRAAIEQNGIPVVVGATTTNPSTAHWGTGQPAGTPGTIIPDIGLSQVDPNSYSAIAFVGGWGASMYQYAYNDPNSDGVTDNFYSNPHYNADSNLNDGVIAPQKVVVNQLINNFLAANKPVGGLCHGVTVLAWARVDGASPIAGKRVVVPHLEGTPDQFYAGAWRNNGYFHGQRDQVIANGGLPTASSGAFGDPTTTSDDVIVDGRIITGENPASSLEFGRRIAAEVQANLVGVAASQFGNNLVVSGTSGNDTVYLWSGASASQVFAWVNGQQFGPFALPANGRVIVHAQGGNDQVFATDLRIGSELLGGDGHDLLVGGSMADFLRGGDGFDRIWGGLGDDFLEGGAGNDWLHGREGNDIVIGGTGDDFIDGGAGNDLLIGGWGADHIRGGANDDLLIGGTTSYDNDQAALRIVQQRWTQPVSIAQRVQSLTPQAGIRLSAGATVFDDASVDALHSELGADWIFHGLMDWDDDNSDDVTTAI